MTVAIVVVAAAAAAAVIVVLVLVVISHAGTVVPECFKDDNASQWKRGKFDPRSLRNP